MALRAFEAIDWTAPISSAATTARRCSRPSRRARPRPATIRTTRSWLCLLDDYGALDRGGPRPPALAPAKHTAGHRKYGSHLDAWRRYADAFGLARS